MISPLAKAESPSQCADALKKADAVIEKQDELILVLSDSRNKLMDENERLSAALVTLARENDSQLQKQITYGVAGVAIGVIATALILGSK